MAKMEATVNVLVRMSLWQAIKLRISGILKNAESFEQQGACIQIKYKPNNSFNLTKAGQAYVIRQARRRHMTKDKRIAELTAALEQISCRTDHGDQEPCEICAICDTALAGQANGALTQGCSGCIDDTDTPQDACAQCRRALWLKDNYKAGQAKEEEDA